jgi:AcrR family transcriptional regulator
MEMMASPHTPTAAETKARLSKELVLAKALELVDAEGLDALTMRRLGQELGCDPMSLYRYAENRAALLDGVSELVLNELPIHAEDPDWKAQLRHIAHNLRLLALRHPNVVPLLVTRPLSTPLGLRPLGTLRPLEQILSLLVGRVSNLPMRCTCTAPATASCTATSLTSCRSSWWTGGKRGAAPAGPPPAPCQGVSPAPCPGAGAGGVRRLSGTRPGTDHPAVRA